MASSRISPPRRPFQVPPTLAPKASDRLAIPKYHSVDPLLGNLSPESTLQALSSADAVPNNEQAAHDILSKSISHASPTERALGIRAAVVAQKLGQWYREVRSWEWPKRMDAQLGKGFIRPSGAEETVYYGSLPVAVVEEYEKRIEEIRDGMDTLDVEELKEHVLNAHIPGRSRPSSANSTMSVPPPLSYVQLSDFTAVITATILRALPYLSRLNALLATWNVRVLVLRQIPGLLQSLQFSRSELSSAIDLLKSSNPPTEKDALYSITNYHAKRVVLESTVLSAGRRMDRILDSLDGREDSLPENWIDDLEAIEAEFASWVMEAEKRTVENEWRRLSARPKESDKPQTDFTQPELPANRDLKESPAKTAKIVPVESPSIESSNSIDAIITPEPVPQTRSAPLQNGRIPMETIVEEIGSPCDRPLSLGASGNSDISIVRATSAPESSSPLPADRVVRQEVLESALVTQLNASCDTAASAGILREASRDFVESNLNSPQCSVGVSSVEEPIHQSENSNYQLPANSNDVTPVSSSEQQSNMKVEEKTSRSAVDAPPTEEPVHLQEAFNNKRSPANMSNKAIISFDIPPSDVGMERNTSRPIDVLPVEETMPRSGGSENDRLADPHVETHPSCNYEEISHSAVTQPEEKSPKELQPSARPNNTPTDLPSTDSVQADPIPKEAESSTQLSPSKTDIKAQASFSQVSAEPKPLSENSVALIAVNESSKIGEELDPIAVVDKETKCLPSPENNVAFAVDNISSNSGELEPVAESNDHPQFTQAGGEHVALNDALVGAGPSETHTPKTPERCVTPPNNNVASLPNLFVPHDNSQVATEQPHLEEPEKKGKNTSKKPLDSPIKIRPCRLDLDKHNPKSRARRTSNPSEGSLSDYPSLVSSPEIPEPRTCSSNGTPLLLETPPHFPRDYRAPKPARQNNDHTLREDRLLHLVAQKPSPRDAFTHNRTLSLPLQRFINESLDVNYDTGSGNEEDAFTAKTSGHKKKTPAERHQKSKSTSSASDICRSNGQKLAPRSGEGSGPDSDGSSDARRLEAKKENQKTSRNPPKPSTRVEPLSNIATTRLKKSLTAHPSLESIGPYKSNAQPGNSSKTIVGKTKPRSSSVSKKMVRPKDQMDEKIHSILTSLPGHIHLVPADQDDDAISVASSVPFRRERFRSNSPQGTPPTRSFTPTPSLTLRPALRRRRYSHAPEESSVKLYHLHRGEKSAPTKLFVRTVGENGGRVMVRVGGGWADLAEYLREYAIHHGRRHVSETPRVEVEGLPSRESPSYSPPATRIPLGSGRPMPARPGSVLSNRPSSSLAVRKTRRSSNVSDMGDIRTTGPGDALNVSFSPISTALSGRRQSVSSNVSAGAMSSLSEVRHGSPGAPAMPLGLAGPKPRAKHATISPESEAWVEDVIGQARRSSSLRPFKYALPHPENEADENTPTLPKSRSISDLGKAGSSKRVVLHGLR
ncbi:hypothetical protein BJX76DRAFT_128147 [Aspergillus varians]